MTAELTQRLVLGGRRSADFGRLWEAAGRRASPDGGRPPTEGLPWARCPRTGGLSRDAARGQVAASLSHPLSRQPPVCYLVGAGWMRVAGFSASLRPLALAVARSH